jgi:NADPH2:quinone reductase
VGGAAAVDATRGLASEGRWLGIGFASGDWPELDMRRILIGNYSVVGVYVGAYGPDVIGPAMTRLFELYEQGAITSGVTTTVAFADLPGALSHLADRSAMGKTVVVM